MRHDPPRVFDERRQEPVFGRRQMDFVVSQKDLASREVDAKVADAEHGVFLSGSALGDVSQRDANPRQSSSTLNGLVK